MYVNLTFKKFALIYCNVNFLNSRCQRALLIFYEVLNSLPTKPTNALLLTISIAALEEAFERERNLTCFVQSMTSIKNVTFLKKITETET